MATSTNDDEVDTERYGWYVAVLMLFCIALGFVLALCLHLYPFVLDEKAAKEWPAIVQAVAAISSLIVAVVGVVIAITVPRNIHKSEQFAAREARNLANQQAAAQELLRQRTYAVAIIPLVEDLLSEVWGARSAVSDWDEPVGWPDYVGAAKRIQLKPELRSLLLQLHELGNPARILQDAFSEVSKIPPMLKYAERYSQDKGVYYCEHACDMVEMAKPDDFVKALDRAAELLSGAIKELGELHGLKSLHVVSEAY